MTDEAPGPGKSDLERDADRLEKQVQDMDRPDRSIPLPETEEEDDGAGPVTGVVP